MPVDEEPGRVAAELTKSTLAPERGRDMSIWTAEGAETLENRLPLEGNIACAVSNLLSMLVVSTSEYLVKAIFSFSFFFSPARIQFGEEENTAGILNGNCGYRSGCQLVKAFQLAQI